MPVYLDDGSTITEIAAIVIDDGTDAAAIDEGVIDAGTGTPQAFWSVGPASLRIKTTQTLVWPWASSQDIRITLVSGGGGGGGVCTVVYDYRRYLCDG